MPHRELPIDALRLMPATANPHGADGCQLYLFAGNPTLGPISKIIPDQGATIPEPRPDLSEKKCRLKILHINDLHGHFSRFLPQGDQPVLSRMVSHLRQVRAKFKEDPDTAVLAMSAGDDLVGAIFDELMGHDPNSFALHAGYRLYSSAGIDVGALGNHDFDLGTNVLAQAIVKDAQFPILSANLVGCRWLAGAFFPAALFVVKGIRVGVIGLTTAGQIRQPPNSNMQIINPIRVIHNMLPAIRPLCDVLIILSHLGYSINDNTASVRDGGDVELARSLPPDSVHLIIGGHTHHVLNEQGLTAKNIVNNIPIVQAGALGRFLGEVDITLQKGVAAATNVQLVSTAKLAVDNPFEVGNVQPLLQMARPFFARPLGHVSNHPDLSSDEVRNAFAAGESALANFITDALVARCHAKGRQVDLAMADASIVRRGLPRGSELSYGQWFNIMPFADVLRIFWVSGRQLLTLVKDNGRRIDMPNEPHTERGFLHFSRQLRYQINMGGRRSECNVSNITFNGIPLEQQLERSFQIVCSNFTRQLASSWEIYGRFELGLPLFDLLKIPHIETSLFLRDELVAYIIEHGGVTEKGGAIRDGRIAKITDSKPATQ